MKANNVSNTGHRIWVSIAGIMLVTLLFTAVQPAQAQQSDARDILRSMSDYVANQQTIEFSFDSSIEVITPQLEKIQFTSSGEVLLNRPNKLKARRTGGYSDVELFFDGKTVSVFDKDENAYARFDGPVSLDQLFHALSVGHGIALPGADLLRSQPYDLLVADVMDARYMGHGVIDGRVCEHLAFRNFDTDWQLWVELGEQPIPRKLVITSKTINSAPQYSVRIREWETDLKPETGAFSFIPPEGAEMLSPDALIHLDELPTGDM